MSEETLGATEVAGDDQPPTGTPKKVTRKVAPKQMKRPAKVGTKKKPSPSSKEDTNDQPIPNDEQEDTDPSYGAEEADSDQDLTSGTVATTSSEPKKPKKTKVGAKPPARRAKVDPRGRKAEYDWDLMYKDYVEGQRTGEGDDDSRKFPTYADLATQYGCSLATIRNRGAEERWREKREAFQVTVTQERQRVRAQKLARKAGEFDEQAFKIADAGLKLLFLRVAEISQEAEARKNIRQTALESLKQGLPIDKDALRTAIWSREMEGLANAAERFQNIAMRAAGTDVQRHELMGPGGTPLEGVGGSVINIHAEITRDDPERVAAILSAMQDAGQFPEGETLALEAAVEQHLAEAPQEQEDIVDAEIVFDEGQVGDDG